MRIKSVPRFPVAWALSLAAAVVLCASSASARETVLTATVTSGRFVGDQIQIANLRDPLASLYCVLTGLSRTTGTSSISFTQRL
jgi:hypothetical protein